MQITRTYNNLNTFIAKYHSFYFLQLNSYLLTGHNLSYSHNMAQKATRANNEVLRNNNKHRNLVRCGIMVDNFTLEYMTRSHKIITIHTIKGGGYEITADEELHNKFYNYPHRVVIKWLFELCKIIRKPEILELLFENLEYWEVKVIKKILVTMKKNDSEKYKKIIGDNEVVKIKKNQVQKINSALVQRKKK